ncbi:MAG: helix-turn-helix domain-containing protein [Nanoarchaeota archaeon]
MAYDKEFKMRCVNHFGLGFSSISEVAQLKKIPKQTLARWIRVYRRFGEVGLENGKPGAKETEINAQFEQTVLLKWKERKRSAHKLWIDMKTKGYSVSERQIQKILKASLME